MSDLATLLADGITENCVLGDVYEIEDILLLIKEVDEKINFYKKLKEHRVKSIDSEVNNLSEKASTLRHVILNTMAKIAPDDKSLKFPSIGKVSRRKGTDTYQVEDQEKVVSFLNEKGLREGIVKTEEKIDRRKLKNLFEQLQSTGEEIPGVKKILGNESISITFEKNTEEKETSAPTRNVSIEDLDVLAV